jgi:hypothetical protein
MRRAMDLIHFVVKDGVLDSAASLVSVPSSTSQPNRSTKGVSNKSSQTAQPIFLTKTLKAYSTVKE